jgi:hypothetical protein
MKYLTKTGQKTEKGLFVQESKLEFINFPSDGNGQIAT